MTNEKDDKMRNDKWEMRNGKDDEMRNEEGEEWWLWWEKWGLRWKNGVWDEKIGIGSLEKG